MKKMTHATASHVAEASTDRRRDAVQQLIGEVSVLHQTSLRALISAGR
jgi:site-specific recombinase XerC